MQMLDAFANYFWQHPIAVAFAAIAAILILIWMTGSGSRQRFITIKRTKESEQLARDLSRIAAALEKIARQREIPVDYLDRPIPTGWENTISAGEPVEDLPPARYPSDSRESAEVNPAAAYARHAPFPPANATAASAPITARAAAATVSAAANARSAAHTAPAYGPATPQETPASENFDARPNGNGDARSPGLDSAPRENSRPARTANPFSASEPAPPANPLDGTAGLLGGKKKLDLPNPLYRPKQ